MRHISIKMFVLWVCFAEALAFFIFLAITVVVQNNTGFDISVINEVHAHETPAQIHFMTLFTFFGSAQFLLPAYIILITGFLIKKNKKYALYIALIGISSTTIMFILKNIFKRHRPPMPVISTITGYSFPSGHALSSFIFCSILSYLIFKSSIKINLKYIFSFMLMLISLTIGLSRIILNVHYASDVIGGFCMGYVLLITAFFIIKKRENFTPHFK